MESAPLPAPPSGPAGAQPAPGGSQPPRTAAHGPPSIPSGTTPSSAAPDTASAAHPATAPVVSEDQVRLALRRVKDPDLNLNIVDLGLVYGIRVNGSAVHVDVTLTSPACPSGPEIVADVEREVATLPGVTGVQVNVVWAPFWTPDRIEPRVRAYLGL